MACGRIWQAMAWARRDIGATNARPAFASDVLELPARDQPLQVVDAVATDQMRFAERHRFGGLRVMERREFLEHDVRELHAVDERAELRERLAPRLPSVGELAKCHSWEIRSRRACACTAIAMIAARTLNAPMTGATMTAALVA
jgi:hypothetical protein